MTRKVQFWDASVRPAARVESLIVLLAACTLLCFEKYIAESLFRHTRSLGWQTPTSSEALFAKKQIQEAFPRRLSGTILMAIEAPRNSTVLCPQVEDFVANVSAKVTSDKRVQQYKPHVLSYWSNVSVPSSVLSRKDFLSPDQRMTLLLIQPTNIPENRNFAKANDFLQEFCSSPPQGFNLHITGAPALATGSGCSSNSHSVMNPQDLSFKCLFFAELVTTPIALLIMGCLVRHWRLLILPLFTVCISFAVSALMLIPWMDHVEVPKDAVAAMCSVILALSLDYSLFLLSRFSENHQDKLTLQENVDIIKACTCRTIAVSGSLVAIAFFAGILLPERNLQGTCIALGFSVLACVATNTVFLPAVFLALGPMFIGQSFLPSWWGDVKLDSGALDEDDVERRGANEGAEATEDANWLSIMRVVERAPVGAILLVLLFVWPVLSAAPSLHITADRFAMMPLYSPAVLAYRKIQDAHLPVGLVNPYEILVTAPQQAPNVLNDEISRKIDSLGLKKLEMAAVKGTASTSQLNEALKSLEQSLQEGSAQLASQSNVEAAPSSFEELMRATSCTNETGSSSQHPHCSCCPNAFLDCQNCEPLSDALVACEAPELQALLATVETGNGTSVDAKQLRILKYCLAKEGVMAAVPQMLPKEVSPKDESKKLADKLFAAVKTVNQSALEKSVLERYPFLVDVVHHVKDLSAKDRGMLLLPSGFDALLELSDDLYALGGVRTLLGHHWILHQRMEWLWAVALAAKSDLRDGYQAVLEHFTRKNQAFFQVHTRFPAIGAMSADWALKARGVLDAWEQRHPGYKVQLAGGNTEAADTREEILRAMWTYLAVSVSLIMLVLYLSFQSLLVPLRLALALAFTLVATFGMGVLVYQTTMMHWFMPELKYFNGITYEVIPLVTGIAIALGLDYDIFLVSRIVEFRVQRYSDRASIFRGVLKTGDVISGAGLIMSLAFSGLIFSDKIFFQQFGVLIITSVLLDTFVVRTILVPALMLIAQKWNWWPRSMPPPIHDVLEGEVESCGGLSQPILAQTSLDRMWEGSH